MRRWPLSLIASLLLSTTAHAQAPSTQQNSAPHQAPGVTAPPQTLNHGGVIAPQTTNDKSVIPADPSHDRGIENPGDSQNMIIHSAPSAQ